MSLLTKQHLCKFLNSIFVIAIATASLGSSIVFAQGYVNVGKINNWCQV